MKKIKNSDKFIENLTDAIASGKDTYIFGYSFDGGDFYYDDEDEDNHNFYVSGGYDIIKLHRTLSEQWIINEDAPLVIVFDYYNGSTDENKYCMIPRIHIFWIEDNKEDNIQKFLEQIGNDYSAPATKPDATFSGLLQYIREHGNECFSNIYDYCTNDDTTEGEFETGAREDVTEELFKRFNLQWDENKRWTIK